MEHLIGRILEQIQPSGEDFLIFDDDSSLKIDTTKFFDINKKGSDKNIAFIDGGNLEILRSPTISLFFNRIYTSTYCDNKRTDSKKIEFYSLIYTTTIGGKIIYRSEYFFINGRLALPEYEFSSHDKSISQGNRRVTPTQIGDALRRYAELALAGECRDCIIVLDGTLEPTYTHEEGLLRRVNSDAICSLAKTTGLITKNGNSACAFISSLTGKNTWYYAAGNHHGASIFFVKLNPASDYVFRFEAKNDSLAAETLSILAENSRDAIFPGYPYGLVEADRRARVSLKEKEMLELQLKLRFKKDFDRMKPYLNSLNAHDVLDSIS